MPSINLITENNSKKSSLSLGKGSIISLVVLAIVFGIYGVLLLVGTGISAKIDDITTEYKAEYDKFLSGDGGEIIDFKNRSTVAKSLIEKTVSSSEIFSKLEETVLSSIYLNSLEYNEKNNTITISGVADNLIDISKQIFNFKRSGYFSSVSAGQILLENKNDDVNKKLKFIIDLNLK